MTGQQDASQLTLNGVPGDAGLYECTYRNKYGDERFTVVHEKNQLRVAKEMALVAFREIQTCSSIENVNL